MGDDYPDVSATDIEWEHARRMGLCTPEHCTQADVPMIFRPHTPRTCPAVEQDNE